MWAPHACRMPGNYVNIIGGAISEDGSTSTVSTRRIHLDGLIPWNLLYQEE